MRVEQTKLYVLVGATVLVFGWVLWNLVPMMIPKGDTQELRTEGWVLANELNQKLIEKPAFADTAFIVESEEPLRLKVVGAVHADAHVDQLRSFVKELRPEGDVVVEVEVIKPH